ncbi:MAG: aminoglycoside phosphotransferase family protein [Nitrospiraceae bacterium]|nr:aminoglycoside phosphotransferase family protein [Nitrospiraceae bacterium]
MINQDAIKQHLRNILPGALNINITMLGSGVHGTGFLADIESAAGRKRYVLKALFAEGLGHDYPSDRAASFLLDLDEFGNIPKHVAALDVLAEMDNGTIKSVGGGKEYYLLMEEASGTNYFHDLRLMAEKKSLDDTDRSKIKLLAEYLAEVHSVKKESRALYWRKLRDNIGHGECLMGVFDSYPDGVLSYRQMAEIEKLCIDWRVRIKRKAHRLCRVHGDFHPGNIWFNSAGDDFVVLDRSRGPWGDAADDITALAINYVFFSIMLKDSYEGAYKQAMDEFLKVYVDATSDSEIFEVAAPFLAFRAAVVANPIFYPELTESGRKKILSFIRGVLHEERFEPGKIADYINTDITTAAA